MRDWQKSSYSGEESNCVEVACGEDRIGVRDTKDRHGAVLTFDRERWTDFLAALKG